MARESGWRRWLERPQEFLKVVNINSFQETPSVSNCYHASYRVIVSFWETCILKYFKFKSKIMKLKKEQQICWPLRRSAGKRRDLEMICTSKDLKISQLQSSIHTFDWLNILGEGKHSSAQNGINWNTKLWFETWITITMIIIRQHISFGTGLNENMTSQSIKWMAQASDCI